MPKGASKKFDQYAQQLWERSQRTIYVIPGQCYTNRHAKLWHYCTAHKAPYFAACKHVISGDTGNQCPLCAGNQTKSIEEYKQEILEKFKGNVVVLPGQEYVNHCTKLKHYCTIHNRNYETKPNNIMSKPGNQCPECGRDKNSEMKRDISLGFVGQITIEGHKITKYLGVFETSKNPKRSNKGARFQYICGRCQNTEAEAWGRSLKTPGNTTGCDKCHDRKETIARHRRDDIWAKSPCLFYIVDVYYSKYLKLGITKDFQFRSIQGNIRNPYWIRGKTLEENLLLGNTDLSYGHCWFKSPELPRAWVFSAEQILLKATVGFKPKDPLPVEMKKAKWPGQTELRDPSASALVIQGGFEKIIQMIEDEKGDWYSVYKRQAGKFNLYKIP